MAHQMFFSVALSSPGGCEVQTSSAVQNIINSDNTVSGHFRLKIGNATSLELPNQLSASAMQVALMTLYDPLVSVEAVINMMEANPSGLLHF